ncbi:MAG: glycoside hydrolase family 11 protein [Chitinispirillaceae bacterium]|nr:glycoside hydrolase family 11 protein [Chitinispirillaceae bacterium]
MPFIRASYVLPAILLPSLFMHHSIAQTITSNGIGQHGGYTYEFWKDDGGSGTMILKDGGSFSCTWNGINNILFRKGKRPGVYNQTVTYSATYNPSGNSYLAVYGWTKNPLVEYYIIETWGSWRPPGGTPKGTIASDNGTYDIYETTRTNAPSIEGTRTFQQYWSVRQSKRTSGTITCANHFSAWAAKNMNMGSFYEVSLVVEGYQSNGNADVTMSMSIGNTGIRAHRSGNGSSKTKGAGARTTNQGYVAVIDGSIPAITFMLQKNSSLSLTLYNHLGQKIATLTKREYAAGQQTIPFNAATLARGIYYYTVIKE